MAETTAVLKYNHVLHYALHYENNLALKLEYEHLLQFLSLVVATVSAAAAGHRKREFAHNTATVIHNLDRIIIAYLPARDLCSFSAVSKLWQATCGAEQLWARCCQSMFGVSIGELSCRSKHKNAAQKSSNGVSGASETAITNSKDLYKMQLARFRQLLRVQTTIAALPAMPRAFLGR